MIPGFLSRIFGTKLPAAMVNPLTGKRLRYLIGAEPPNPPAKGRAVTEVGSYSPGGRVTEVGYDAEGGGDIAYCNLFNEKYSEQNTSERAKYGPYLRTSDTAQEYNEGQIDPSSAGWLRNLDEQFTQRRKQGFKYIELDNCDAYSSAVVLDAYDRAAERGFYVIAKNPGICKDGLAMVKHPAVGGIIVEKDCGTPMEMERLRKQMERLRKQTLPVWFVCFDRSIKPGAGWRWGHLTFNAITNADYKNMFVTWSRDGEYVNAIDF